MATRLSTRLAVLPLEARDVPAAGLQFLHQSPYAAVASVDVYINGVKTIDDVPFRQSTAFLTVPDSVPLKIDVVSRFAADDSAPLTSRTVTLPAGGNGVVALVGDPGSSSPTEGLTLTATTAARSVASDPTKVDVTLLPAVPELAGLDVRVRRAETLANDASRYAFVNGYASLAPGKYVLDVTRADGVSRVGSYNLDVTGAAGTARTLVASGFAKPAFPTDPTVNLMAIDGKGFGTVLTRARPFGQTSYAVGGDGTATLFNFDGTAKFTVTLPPVTLPDGTAVPRLNSLRVAAADVNNDGVADLIAAAGPGSADPRYSLDGVDQVSVYDGTTGARLKSLTPFEATFTGGLFVAAGDLDNDGYADIVLSPDQGGGPRVQILGGKTFQPMVPDFFGIADPAFRGGARPALADLNGDGVPDLIVAAGFGGGPRVAVFNGLTLLPGGSPGRLVGDFFAFESTLRNGAYVAGGDVTGDGFAELIAGGGPGGAPRVVAFSGASLVAPASSLVPVANFFAGDASSRDGVRVAAKDLDGDYRIDLVAALGPDGPDSGVRTFAGKSLPLSGAATPQSVVAFNAPGGAFVG
jgi:hypothetical protein